ncbi:hypothetical protein OK016_10700 [Vibrio chagasii]|nr:hypothetical protein [Vibrio chagasii]
MTSTLGKVALYQLSGIVARRQLPPVLNCGRGCGSRFEPRPGYEPGRITKLPPSRPDAMELKVTNVCGL